MKRFLLVVMLLALHGCAAPSDGEEEQLPTKYLDDPYAGVYYTRSATLDYNGLLLDRDGGLLSFVNFQGGGFVPVTEASGVEFTSRGFSYSLTNGSVVGTFARLEGTNVILAET